MLLGGNVLDLYSRDTQFESWSWDGLIWLKLFVASLVPQVKYWYKASNKQRPLPSKSNSLLMSHHTIWCYIVSTLKASFNNQQRSTHIITSKSTAIFMFKAARIWTLEWKDNYWMMNWKDVEVSHHGHIWITIPEYGCRYWEIHVKLQPG
jgi:hypothetical protein